MWKLIRCTVNMAIVYFFICAHASAQTQLNLITKTKGSTTFNQVRVFDLSQNEIYTLPYKDTLNFQFKKTTTDCYNIHFIAANTTARQQLWLDAGNVTIKGTVDSAVFTVDTVLHAPAYYSAKAFFDSLRIVPKTDTAAYNKFLWQNLERNINSPFSLMIAMNHLVVNQNSVAEVLRLREYLDRQGKQFTSFVGYAPVNDRINAILNSNSISMAAYRFYDLNNKLSKLNLNANNVYILDLWFVACKPCVEQHKLIKEKYAELTRLNASVIGIATDEDFSKWKKYLTSHSYTWKNVRESSGKKITKDFGISAFPSYILIKNNGQILRMYNSFDDVLEFLREFNAAK